MASEAECNICEQCECECAAELHFDPSDEGWYCEECFVEEYGSAWRDFVGVLPAVAAGVVPGIFALDGGQGFRRRHARGLAPIQDPPGCSTSVDGV